MVDLSDFCEIDMERSFRWEKHMGGAESCLKHLFLPISTQNGFFPGRAAYLEGGSLICAKKCQKARVDKMEAGH